MNIVSVFERSAERHPDRVAFTDDVGDTTFAELLRRAVAFSGLLATSGLAVGDRVLDLQPNGTRFVESDVACARSGLVRVCLNPRLTEKDWHRIADDCGARGLIVDERYLDRAAALADGMDHVFVLDGDHDRRLAAAPRVGARIAELVSLNYTSGTTGAPKGVRRHHSHRLASLDGMLRAVLPAIPSAGDAYLHAAPMTHTSGLFTLPFVAAGARQVILDRFDAETFAEAVSRHGVTHTALVPTMIARLLAADVRLGRELTMLGYAGAPLPPEQIRAAHARLTPALTQYYGLVEAIPPVTVLDADDHARAVTEQPELLTSAGRPVPGVAVRIVDTDGREVPVGEVGEVVTAGRHVTSGYWGRSTGVKALSNGELHTGDIGRFDADGYLWLVDRLGDMIISGGYNIYPREIEDVIAAVEGVEHVAVYGVPHEDWGQAVTAAYTGTATAEAVLTACRRELASFKKPKHVHHLTRMPVNSNGKIDKTELRRS